MKRLAAGQTPKPRNTGRETRDTGSETQNTLLAAGPMEDGLAKKKIRPNGFFKRMSDERLIEYTQEIMKENGITTRKGLQKTDSGLYIVLRRRNLLEQVIPESANELHRDWVGMSDERIDEFTQEFMKENGITTREGLKKADNGLRTVLRRRNLLEQTIPESKHEGYRESRDWATRTDEAVIEFAQEFMKEKGITTRIGLQNVDSGLHEVLRRRGLLPQIEFEEIRRKERSWAMMSDTELVRAAQEFMKEKGITTREGVKKADSGLESVLRRRNLLERAFAEVDETKRAEGLDAVCTALEEFGEDGWGKHG